jgi:hypothetical protein
LAVFLVPSAPFKSAFVSASPEPKIYISPSKIRADPGQFFAVNVSIADASNIYAWEVFLKWEPFSVFNYTDVFNINVTEGEFLKRGGMMTSLYSKIERPPIGRMQVGCTLVGAVSGKSGNGTLATLSFQVREKNSTTLDLYDTDLRDSTLALVPHTAVDGFFTTKFDSSISLEVHPTSIELSKSFDISGSINPALVGANVTLKYRAATGTWSTLANSTTNQTSQYFYQWAPTSLGTYEIQASWAGNATTLGDDSDVKTVTVTKQSSTISLTITPTSLIIGSRVNMTGEITPTRPGATVSIKYRFPGGVFSVLTTVTTGSDGKYTYTWEPPSLQTYEIQASWAGDANTLGAESSTVTIKVESAAAEGIDPTILAGAVIAIIVVVVVVYFVKRSRRSK